MIVNAFARHAPWIAITLLLVNLALRFLPGAPAQRAMTSEMAQFVERMVFFPKVTLTPETQGLVQRRENQ